MSVNDSVNSRRSQFITSCNFSDSNAVIMQDTNTFSQVIHIFIKAVKWDKLNKPYKYHNQNKPNRLPNGWPNNKYLVEFLEFFSFLVWNGRISKKNVFSRMKKNVIYDIIVLGEFLNMALRCGKNTSADWFHFSCRMISQLPVSCFVGRCNQ